MSLYHFLILVLICECHVKAWFTLPKGLTFLGCLFKCPNNFNDSAIMFPEVACKTKIPKYEKNPVEFCKKITKKSDKIFGVCDDTCLHSSLLHLVIPHEKLERDPKKSCKKKMKIYSFVGDLYDKEKRSLGLNKRRCIATPSNTTRRSVLPVGNLFINNDFEIIISKKRKLEILSWTCQGEESHFQPMYASTHRPKHGKYSGICSNRETEEQGPAQHIGKLVKANGIYRVHGWTKLLHAQSKDELSTIELWVKWKSYNSYREEKKLLAQRNKLINNTGWVYWASQFHLPDESFHYVLIYFKGPKTHVDILIDSMSLEVLHHSDNWKEFTDKQIDKIRKRDVTVRVSLDKYQYNKHELANTKLEIKQVSSLFGFGAAVYYDALENNTKYRKFLKEHFEWATMESSLKWAYMERVQGVSNHAKTDKMLKILVDDLKMSVRGHCVFWESPEHIPSWVHHLNKNEMKSAMRNRMINVVLRYRKKFRHWDVNNEMLQDTFFIERLGKDIHKWIFESTHQLDPDAILFVNELDVLAAPFLTQSYLEFVKQLKDNGVPVGAIGVQGHFTNSAHSEIIKDRLDILAQAGLPIWITEFDIKEQDENKRAEILETVMRVAYSHPSVHGIILWSFWDKHSWRGNNTSLFEGEDFKPNKVGKIYLQLREEWKTTPQALAPLNIMNNGVEFNFQAFHGHHIIKITLPDNEVIEKRIMVANHHRELLVDFKAHVRDVE